MVGSWFDYELSPQARVLKFWSPLDSTTSED